MAVSCKEDALNRAKALLPPDIIDHVTVSSDGLVIKTQLPSSFLGFRIVSEVERYKSSCVRDSLFVTCVQDFSPTDPMLIYALPQAEMLHVLTRDQAIKYAAVLLWNFSRFPQPPNAYHAALLCAVDDGDGVARVMEIYQCLVTEEGEEVSVALSTLKPSHFHYAHFYDTSFTKARCKGVVLLVAHLLDSTSKAWC